MRRIFVSTLLLLFVSGFITHCYGFDGKRGGFLLGGGIGPGYTSFTQTIEYLGFEETSDRENKLSVITNFMLGGGVSDNMLVYYVNRVSWFSIENVFMENVIIIAGMSGLGLTYYFSPKAPSGLIKGAFGLSTWAAPFEEGSEYWLGIGFMFGLGYEFSPHWSIETDVFFGSPSDEEMGLKATSNIFSLQLTFHGIAY